MKNFDKGLADLLRTLNLKPNDQKDFHNKKKIESVKQPERVGSRSGTAANVESATSCFNEDQKS